MKKMITLAAVAAISTSASAFDYKVGLEGRADFVQRTTKTEVGTTTTKNKDSGFETGLIRLSLTGNINENLTYKLRYRFNRVDETETTKDNSTTNLDHLYIDHKNSFFTTRFGKTNWAEAYGRESFISSTDLFITSAAYSAYNTNVGTYRFGVSGTYTFLDTNKLTLAISNPNPNKTDTVGEQKNTSLAYAAHYSSVLMDKLIQPTLSYTMAKQDNAANGTNSMMAAGFRSEVANLVVDADWKQFKREDQGVAGADEKTTSIFANVAYSIDQISPFVQYINDKAKAVAGGDYKKNSFAVGAMWKPFNETNFRYHLSYINSNKKFDVASNGKVKENTIVFGIKADI
jgi:hypothetical protein